MAIPYGVAILLSSKVMSGKKFFNNADLPALHAHAVQEVKKSPQDAAARALFIQVLCMEGEWDRAATQADALLKLNPASAMFCTTVSQLITAEKHRTDIFNGKEQPNWTGKRPAYADALAEVLKAYGNGNLALGAEKTVTLLDRIPTISVAFNSGKKEEWILDGDARLAGVIEWMKGDAYSLIAMEEVASLELAAPTHPIEILWPHARLTLRNGEIITGRCPGRYPVNAAIEDASLLMARATAWQEVADGIYLGQGQKCWNTPNGIIPVLQEAVLRFQQA